jgi:DMSO/TMAO reductase YedYZ molybdopterin-dependent catalytic subunit
VTTPEARRSASLGHGLLAGLIAGLVMTIVLALLRILAGIPLPVELISDRVIPTLSIRQFFDLAALLGGLLQAKEVSLLSSFAIQALAGAGGGAIYALIARGGRRAMVAAATGLAVLWALFVAVLWPILESNYRGLAPGSSRLVNALALLVAFALYGATLVMVLRALSAREPMGSPVPAGRPVRRRVVVLGGLAWLLAVLTAGLARFLYGRATVGPSGYDGLQVRGPRTDSITPNDRFYVVTKNLVDPDVNGSLWRLEVTGSVDRPHTYDFDELSSLPSVEQLQTLECISNAVGGGLMSNAAWRGVPLRTLIDAARPRAEITRVVLHASDGYVHVLRLDKALEPTTLVAYEMNGVPLPHRHGYPARVLVPGTYGEVSVKWVDRIELTAEAIEGYYERQGWEPFFVETTSRFDRPRNGQELSLRSTPVVELGGVAFAGDRGVSTVEVSTDGGVTWKEAAIDYAPSPLAWALWSAEWEPQSPGEYALRVRATDGRGSIQSSERRFVAPSGATGHHEVKVRVTP